MRPTLSRTLLASLLLLACLAPGALAQSGGRYVDREQGFSLAVPEGWSGTKDASALAPGVLLGLWSPDRASVYTVRVTDSQGYPPGQITALMASAAPGRGFQVVRRTQGQVAGQPASTLVCESAKGVEQTTVVVFGNRAFLLQSAAPDRATFKKSFATFGQVTLSFRPELSQEAYGREASRLAEERREAARYERLRQERMRRDRLERERLDRERR